MSELSQDILSYLDCLDKYQAFFDNEFLEEYAKDMYGGEEKKEDDGDAIKEIRKIISDLINSKKEPVNKKLTDHVSKFNELISLLDESAVSNPYNEYFDEYYARLLLKQVPNFVRRTKKLGSIILNESPSYKVGEYFLQTSTCYIYGIYNAVSILSRSVVQFCLEDAFRKRNIIIPRHIRTNDYLFSLIRHANGVGMLTNDLFEKSDGVRKDGNKAAHRRQVDEKTAFKNITDTLEILTHIYKE